MGDLEGLILKSLEEKKADELLKFLAARVVEECAEEIDANVARSSLYSRSISSSSGTNSSIIEKRVIQRRFRSTVNSVANTAKFKALKRRILKQVERTVGTKNETCNAIRPATGFNFEIDNFFFEELKKEKIRKSGKFLNKFAILLDNLDFMVEARNRLSLPNTVIRVINKYCKNHQNKIIIDEFFISCLNLISKIIIGSQNEKITVHNFEDDSETIFFMTEKFKKLNELSKGLYRRKKEKFKPDDIKIMEDDFSLDTVISYWKKGVPIEDILKKYYSQSPTPYTIKWMNPIFDYAVYLDRASTRTSAHRNAVQLRLPYLDNDRNDFFTGVIFLISECNSKLTNFILSALASEEKNSIKVLWSMKFESTFEFMHFLRQEIWFNFGFRIQRKKKFIDLVDFCYRCGLGILDFELVEQLILTAVFGETKDVIDLFLHNE